MVITSVSNPKVKWVRSLFDAKERRLQGLYIAEGANLIKDIPSNTEVVAIFLKESKVDLFAEIIEAFSCEKVILSDKVFDAVSDTVTPAGILAVIKMPKTSDISEISAERVIVLDNVSDSGNVGAIIRTAVAAGYTQAVFIGGADPFSSKAVRASMSAIFKIQVFFCDKIAFLYSKTISTYDIIILDMCSNNIFDYCPTGKVALVVGNEAHGVSPELKAIGHKLSIPMQNMESLNAAVSAGIAMYVITNNHKL